MKHWIGLLVFQIMVGANAGIVFSHLPRGWAGLVAGTGFVIFGALALYMFWTRSVRLRSFNIFVAGFFLVGLSLPMALARILTPFDRPVAEVFGVPLQLLHQPSLYVFWALFLMICLQIGFSFAQKQKSQG